jgi:DNA-binding NarL/FixJ family response regulator
MKITREWTPMMNQYGLTKRELEVARLLLEGKCNFQIAFELDILEAIKNALAKKGEKV